MLIFEFLYTERKRGETRALDIFNSRLIISLRDACRRYIATGRTNATIINALFRAPTTAYRNLRRYIYRDAKAMRTRRAYYYFVDLSTITLTLGQPCIYIATASCALLSLSLCPRAFTLWTVIRFLEDFGIRDNSNHYIFESHCVMDVWIEIYFWFIIVFSCFTQSLFIKPYMN